VEVNEILTSQAVAKICAIKLYFLLTLTLWSKVLEKLTAAQMVKNAFYGNKRFITVFTKTNNWTVT
jgi:hypothetical protein